MEEYLQSRKKNLGDVPFEDFFEGIVPDKLYRFLLSEFAKDENATKEQDKDLAFLKYLKNVKIKINGHAGFESAQSTRGGVVLDELSDDLESKLVSNLYLIGEMLNVDGDCGGYNLQWAFSGGKCVGEKISVLD